MSTEKAEVKHYNTLDKLDKTTGKGTVKMGDRSHCPEVETIRVLESNLALEVGGCTQRKSY
jgi:hypothetical protein